MFEASRRVVEVELKASLSSGGSWINVIAFFLVVSSLFGITFSSEMEVQPIIAPGVLWVALVLAAMLSLESALRKDFDEGFLEQALLSDSEFWIILLSKAFVHWLLFFIPMLLISFLVAALLQLSFPEILICMVTFLIGSPALVLLGFLMVGLSLRVKTNVGIILSVLLLPLYVPIMLFAVSTVTAFREDFSPMPSLSIMTAISLLVMAVVPSLMAKAVKMSVTS